MLKDQHLYSCPVFYSISLKMECPGFSNKSAMSSLKLLSISQSKI